MKLKKEFWFWIYLNIHLIFHIPPSECKTIAAFILLTDTEAFGVWTFRNWAVRVGGGGAVGVGAKGAISIGVGGVDVVGARAVVRVGAVEAVSVAVGGYIGRCWSGLFSTPFCSSCTLKKCFNKSCQTCLSRIYWNQLKKTNLTYMTQKKKILLKRGVSWIPLAYATFLLMQGWLNCWLVFYSYDHDFFQNIFQYSRYLNVQKLGWEDHLPMRVLNYGAPLKIM